MKRWLIGLATAAGVGAATVLADIAAGGGVSMKGAVLAILLAAGALKGALAYLKETPPPVEE